MFICHNMSKVFATFCLHFAFLAVYIFTKVKCSKVKVHEYGQEFLTRNMNQAFLIKFYAPWCGHCIKLEPTFDEVYMKLQGSDVKVGRIDATIHSVIASTFEVRGFPTIKYIKGDQHYSHRGERTVDDIITFVNRVNGPAVQNIASPGKFSEVLKTIANDAFFLFIGNDTSEEFKLYSQIAEKMRTESNFYKTRASLFSTLDFDVAKMSWDASFQPFAEPSLLVFKQGRYLTFMEEFNDLSLRTWMADERYLIYPKIGEYLFYSFYPISKYIVAFIINETSTHSDEMLVRKMGEQLAFEFRHKYPQVQFSWTGKSKSASELAMTYLPTPNIIVMNPSTAEYYLHDNYSYPIGKLDMEAMQQFLDRLLNGQVRSYGGDSFWERLKRVVYDFMLGLADFVMSHPGIAIFVIGAPVGVISLLCYAICCLDSADDDTDGGWAEPDDSEVEIAEPVSATPLEESKKDL